MLNIRSVVTLAATAAFAAALLVTQNASAAERHNAQMRKHQTTIFTSSQARGAYAAVGANGATGAFQPNWSRYEGGAISAPAGRS